MLWIGILALFCVLIGGYVYLVEYYGGGSSNEPPSSANGDTE